MQRKVSRKKHWGDGSRERGETKPSSLPLHFFHFFRSIPSYWDIIQNIYIIHLQGLAAIRLSTDVLGKQKTGFEKAMKKSAGWKCENGVGIQEQNPPFQTLFPLRPTVIYCVILLMTNIDCKIVVLFFLNKNSFLCTKHAQSMQLAISLTSLPSLTFYSFTMFTK